MLTRVVVAGGGTGGHVFTGVAVLDELRRRAPDAAITYLGSSLGQEARLVPASGYLHAPLDVRAIRLGGPLDGARALAKLPAAVVAAAELLVAARAQVVLGVGGAVAGPALVAASLLGLPAVLHEQNTIPGLANRWLRPFVKHVMLGFGEAGPHFPRHTTTTTGNPVRRSVARLLAGPGRPVKAAGDGVFEVLVLGGSDGSDFLNAQVPAALIRAAAQTGARLRVHHQAGHDDLAAIRARYWEGLGAEVVVEEFIDDIGAAYARADLAVARGGALSLAELALAGVPTLIVPLAGAADDHQTQNARVYRAAGAALVQSERRWATADAGDLLARMIADAGLREGLSRRIRALARPDAAARVVDGLERRARDAGTLTR
ncbi:MAG: glycosyltransferase [Deltaproteobacteria bacterium]|nr:glycosyltransferase [Deltaproteobacteria bacterium]